MSKHSKVTSAMIILHTLLMILSFVVMKYRLDMDSTLVIIVEGASMGFFTGIDEVKDGVYQYFYKWKLFFKYKWIQFIIGVLGSCWFIYIKVIPAKKFLVVASKLLYQMKVHFWYVKWKVFLLYITIKLWLSKV
ncbi:MULTISPECIES: hypothetical protein [Bacillus cereus group]|uniref:hypothetical protein n=1 Tax=Bacillus cereus group TaxID=86661 RepID=UPI001C033E73|nr:MULTISPECIES: hypothetical protein [Bacillus cereus group]MCU5097264.1 hypothetical protein [Bacillus wiedmannii]QWG33373.1 hypothetical protein EXW30_10745 [Bacillus mycoides]